MTEIFRFYLKLTGLIVCLLSTWSSIQATENPKATSIDWKKAREWWAFQPPKKSKLPLVSDSNWPSQRIDYFILAKLDAKQLTRSQQASKRILARRLFFDITGLPPTPKEWKIFFPTKLPMHMNDWQKN